MGVNDDSTLIAGTNPTCRASNPFASDAFGHGLGMDRVHDEEEGGGKCDAQEPGIIFFIGDQ